MVEQLRSIEEIALFESLPRELSAHWATPDSFFRVALVQNGRPDARYAHATVMPYSAEDPDRTYFWETLQAAASASVVEFPERKVRFLLEDIQPERVQRLYANILRAFPPERCTQAPSFRYFLKPRTRV